MSGNDWRAVSRANRERAAGQQPPSAAPAAAPPRAAAVPPSPPPEPARPQVRETPAPQPARLPRLNNGGWLPTGAAAGVLSMAVAAVALTMTGAQDDAFYRLEWPLAVPVLLGIAWGLFHGKEKPWPDLLLMVCGGVVVCVTLALFAGAMAVGFEFSEAVSASLGTAMEAFTDPLLPVHYPSGAPLSFSLFYLACWGLVGAALWKAWHVLQLRRAALGLLVAAGLAGPAAARVPLGTPELQSFLNEFMPYLNSQRFAEARVVAVRFMEARPSRYNFDPWEITPENRGDRPRTDGELATYFFWRVMLEGEGVSMESLDSVYRVSGVQGAPLLWCLVEWRKVEPPDMAANRLGPIRADMRNRTPCRDARQRFPGNPAMVELFGAAPAPAAPPAAAPQASPRPSPAPPPAAAPAPRPAPVPAAPVRARRSTPLENWRTFDMLAIGAAALFGGGWWLRRRKLARGGV